MKMWTVDLLIYTVFKRGYIALIRLSSQAKGTNSTSFLTHVRNEVELVPLACEDVIRLNMTNCYSTLLPASSYSISWLSGSLALGSGTFLNSSVP